MSSNISGSLAVGVQTLRANPLRTVLSTLGVIMGVASLVAVLAIGDGVEAFAREQIESTTDLQALMIVPSTSDMIDNVRIPRTDYPVFTLADATELAARLRSTAVVAILVQGSARIAADTGRARAAIVMATTPAAAQLMRKPLASGRFFTDREVADREHVAIVSPALSAIIQPGSTASAALGKSLTIEGSKFTIVGVAPSDPRQGSLSVWVPVTVASSAMARVVTPRAPDRSSCRGHRTDPRDRHPQGDRRT